MREFQCVNQESSSNEACLRCSRAGALDGFDRVRRGCSHRTADDIRLLGELLALDGEHLNIRVERVEEECVERMMRLSPRSLSRTYIECHDPMLNSSSMG